MSNPMEMNNLDKNEQKPVANKFAALHQDEPISADIYNLSNPDALPAPLVVSKRNAADKYKNKIVLLLENKSADRIVLGGLHRTGIYINLNDLMAVSDMHRIRVTVEDKPAQTNLVYPMFTFPGVVDPELRDPSVPPMPNNEHLGIDPVFYIWLEDEIELGQYDRIKVVFEGVVSDFQPALRYIDLSWDFRRIDYSGGSLTYAPLEGFHQLTVQLQRPIDYLEPPLPVQAHWLNNNNVIYSSNGTGQAIQNELTFAFSNTGLQDFVLDCSRHSKGAPYFELVMVAIEDGDEVDFSSAVGKVSELKDAQLKNTTPDPDLNQLWRTNKRIQGPVVKWEIRPDLNFETEQELGRYQENKKILIGIDRKATITFQLSNLVSSLEAGVALVYFKYYNMPEHDDGQLVLFLEKREVGKPTTLTPQLPVADNQMTPPLQWDYKEEKGGMKTVVALGDRVGIGTDKPWAKLDILGDVLIRPKEKNNKNASLQLSAKGNNSMGRTVKIEAVADDSKEIKNNKAAKLKFSLRDNAKEKVKGEPDKDMTVRMVIDSEGRVGIGTEKPAYALDVEGDIRLTKDIIFPFGNSEFTEGKLKKGNGSLELIVQGYTSLGKPKTGIFRLNTNDHSMFEWLGKKENSYLETLLTLSGDGNLNHNGDFRTNNVSIQKRLIIGKPGTPKGLGISSKGRLHVFDHDRQRTRASYPNSFVVFEHGGGEKRFVSIIGERGRNTGITFALDGETDRGDLPIDDGGIFYGDNSSGDQNMSLKVGGEYALKLDGTHRTAVAFSVHLRSDRRIKKLIKDCNPIGDLYRLKLLRVVEYSQKTRPVEKEVEFREIGFIAQEVEEVLPHVILKSEDYIPSINAYPVEIKPTENGRMIIEMAEPHDLQSGDELKLNCPSGEKIVQVLSVSDRTFTVKAWEEQFDPSQVVVYGKKVDDFRSVNYNAIFTMGISATQELARRQEQLQADKVQLQEEVKTSKARITQLEEEVAGLRREFAAMRAEMRAFRAGFATA